MGASFSAETRARNLQALGEGAVDLLVVGAGITGAGIAREAAMRGLRTALVDRDDFGSGTSGRSSRLIHGGLRYLELGDLRLVFEASRERRTLLRIAPHLVWPRSFLFPAYKGNRVPGWKLAAGLLAYDMLALFRNVKRHRWLSKRGILKAEPALRTQGLTGGGRYHDAQCDDGRLTLATARDAHRHGALVANYVRMDRLELADGRVRGARLTDVITGSQHTVRALAVVNATGPWSDLVRADGTQILRLTRGAHAVVPRSRIGHNEAVTMLSPIDGRVMFVLPWGNVSYIGTTDTDHEGGPDDVHATADDVVYLLRSVNAYFPDARLQPADVISTWASLRPLVRAPADAPGKVPREHLIQERGDGLISIVGGKLTTYRVMAHDVIQLVVQRLAELDGRPIPPDAPTGSVPLPGGETQDLDRLAAQMVEEGTSAELARHLVRRYGAEAPAVARLASSNADLALPVAPAHQTIRAEMVHAIRREMAMTLKDLLIRRTHLFYELKGQGAGQAPAVADLAAQELGWDAVREARELALYLEEIERQNAFLQELDRGE